MAVGLALTFGLPLGFGGAAGAQEEPPAASFSGFGLEAAGEAVNIYYDGVEQPAHPTAQIAIPEAIATLSTGPSGTGFSALGWPGPVVGNLGGVIQAQGGPPDANVLNYPVRAEAFAPQGPEDAKNEVAPGVVLTAHADTAKTSATGTVQRLGDPADLLVGSATSSATAALDGALGAAESNAAVTQFSLMGVLTIDSVVSRARATTNGVEGKFEGGTILSGVKVADQPATIDERGLTIGDSTSPSPADAILNQVAREALQQAGITVAVTKPFEEREGGKVSFTAGSVVISFSQEGNTFAVVLGGSTAKANAVLGDPDAAVEDLVDVAGGGELPLGGGSDVGGLDAPTLGGSFDSGAPATTSGDGESSGGGAALADLTGDPIGFYGGLPGGLLVAIAFGAGLIAVGLRRLADDVFASAGPACALLERKATG